MPRRTSSNPPRTTLSSSRLQVNYRRTIPYPLKTKENPSADTILPDVTKTQGIYIRWTRINIYVSGK